MREARLDVVERDHSRHTLFEGSKTAEGVQIAVDATGTAAEPNYRPIFRTTMVEAGRGFTVTEPIRELPNYADFDERRLLRI
jgi:hypothetical protein